MAWFKNPKLSIIIPTLNEEKYLPKLLGCLEKQTFKDFEVIVSDSHSKDKTIKTAKKFRRKFKIQFVSGLKKGPGYARNLGAERAKGDYFLFLDADVKFNRHFIKKCLKEFDERYLDVATCTFKPLSKKVIDKILHDAGSVILKALQYISPIGGGFCIFATKRIHKRINGFNTKLRLNEDHDYLNRAGTLCNFAVLKPKIKVSVRRLELLGRSKLIMQYLKSGLTHLAGGQVTAEQFKKYQYSFGGHKK